MVFPVGTISQDAVTETLRDFLQARFANAAYASRLSGFRTLVTIAGERNGTGVQVDLIYGAEPESSWAFVSEGHQVVQEYHRIVIDVDSDEKGGSRRRNNVAAADEIVYSLISQMMVNPSELDLLKAVGIYDLRKSSEAQEIAGVEFTHPLEITCSTFTLLS